MTDETKEGGGTVAQDPVRALADATRELARSSTAERIAEVLRERITAGALEPGVRLSEESIGTALRVSRNTLREAFRLLSHERLLVHELHRGVSVARPTATDVVDLYRARRSIELSALRGPGVPSSTALERLYAAVEEGQRCMDASDWTGIGTANMAFHRAIAALHGSTRLDEYMRQLLAELRLVFHVMQAPRDFHAPYLSRNRKLCDLLTERRLDQAHEYLANYLTEAEDQLLTAFHDRGQTP